MSSYLHRTKRTVGQRGGDAFKARYDEGIAKLLKVIEGIECLGDDSTIADLRERKDAGEETIRIEEAIDALRDVRKDLLDAHLDLTEARKAAA